VRAVCYSSCAFFFQAEDGIRDDLVTGVQTCALPICAVGTEAARAAGGGRPQLATPQPVARRERGALALAERRRARRESREGRDRSEERRVGKEGRVERSPSDT